LRVEKGGIAVEEYQYDLNGNRIDERNTLRGISRAFTYSPEDHCLSAGSTSYEMDSDGFLKKKISSNGTSTYTYSSRGELLEVILPDSTKIEYLHDPLGRRIAKKVNGSITEKYLWQGETRLLAVFDGSENLIMRFSNAGGRLPLSMERYGSTYYLVCDQVGSLRAVVDSAGNVVKEIEYDSFGNILSDTDLLFEIPLGFAGGLHDRDTGLVRFGARDYDPDTGRWAAKDPIFFAGGDANLYGYGNDPVNMVDPLGLNAGPIYPGPGPFPQVDITVGIPFVDHTVLGMLNTSANTANWLANRLWLLLELAGSDTALNMSMTTPFPYDDALVAGIGCGVKFTKQMLSSSEKIAEGRRIHKVEELVEKFGGKVKDWVKKKGWDERGQEWHWYENKGKREGLKRVGEPDPF